MEEEVWWGGGREGYMVQTLHLALATGSKHRENR